MNKTIVRYLPFTIYQTLQKFLEYRQLELISGNLSETKRRIKKGRAEEIVGSGAKKEKGEKGKKEKGEKGKKEKGEKGKKEKEKKEKIEKVGVIEDETKFIELLQIDGYVVIAADDKPEKVRRYPRGVPKDARVFPTHTYIVIIEPNHKATSASAEFEKILKSIPDFSASHRNFNLDIIVLTPTVVKSNIQGKIAPYVTDGTAATGSEPAQGFVYINNYPYRVFTTVLPEHIMVPPHYILSKQEAEQVLRETHCNRRDLPKMSRNDPIAIWIGAVPGDIVEVEFDSEDTTIDVKYHLIL